MAADAMGAKAPAMIAPAASAEPAMTGILCIFVMCHNVESAAWGSLRLVCVVAVRCRRGRDACGLDNYATVTYADVSYGYVVDGLETETRDGYY